VTEIEWRVIPGLSDRFEASSEGQIRRAATFRARGAGQPLTLVKLQSGRHGYLLFSTYINSNRVVGRAHRFIALAFLGPVPPGKEVAHINGRASDNRVANLMYATRKENNGHKYAHGTILWGERNPTAKLTADDVAAIRAHPKKGIKALAASYGVHYRHLWRIRKGLRWQHTLDQGKPSCP